MGGGRPHLSTRQANPPWHSLQPPEADVPIRPVLQRRRPQLREVKGLGQRDTANK